MPADLYTAVMSIPGADRALDFLQKQASAFAYVPARLETFRRELEELRSRAAARNDPVGVAKAAAALVGLPRLQSLYASASGKVSEVMTLLRLGSGNPLALVPKVIGAAAQAALVFKSVDLFDKAIDKLAAGTLTAQELAQLKAGGYTVQNALTPAVKVVLVVGGAWLVWRAMRGR
jgi:hypothetical protein